MLSPCYFIDLDTQNDFFEKKGAQYVKQVERIIPLLKLLREKAFLKHIPIFSGVESYGMQDFLKTQRKPYAIRGTHGSKKIPETLLKKTFVIPQNAKKIPASRTLLKKYPQIILEKSRFDFFNNPHAIKLLRSTKIRNCVMYGIALDYGLQMATSRLLKEGFQVWIPVDAVWCINEENREKALIELRKLGVHMWNTAFILENL